MAADGDPLRRYWTRDPRGLAKWAEKPHPWTALYRHLKKHMADDLAKRLTESYFRDVFGIKSGYRRGDNPTGPG